MAKLEIEVLEWDFDDWRNMVVICVFS